MKHGVPWVAFDCPFGPASIIKDGSCGFLIENGNSPMFTNKLNFLMENEDVRHKFSKECLVQAERYNIDIVMRQWQNLFELV